MTTQKINSPTKISEGELQETLHEFLEENDKKSKESIWNIKTLAGLGFIFTSFAYIGHSIATEVLGLSALPVIYPIMKFVPYLAGAMLGIHLMSVFAFSGKKEKEKEREEEVRVKKTYDKLDSFLYPEGAKSDAKSFKKSKKFASGSILSPTQKLFKSRTDSYISGVCGGLAKYLGISSTAIRIIFLAALFLGYGSFFLVYIAMAIVMPKEPISLMDDFN